MFLSHSAGRAGGGNEFPLFPLPTSRPLLSSLFPNLDDAEISWLIAICLGLNSVWGEELHSDSPVKSGQRDCLGLLLLKMFSASRL